jgi:hypothetical protein
MKYHKELESLLNRYKNNIEEDLKERWNNWEKDLSTPEKFEVIGGLMSRQITIAINFMTCPSIWNAHIAPIIMRSLVDNYINFAWIMEDPLVRSRKFIYFGLGQAKLQLEHRKEELKNHEASEEEMLVVESMENWINQQRFTFLTEVSLKSWSETSVRQMAEEANCIDLYNYVYQPFSSSAHNMWNHIARYNLIESDNPLHKFFRRPAIFEFPTDIHYVELSAKYVDKMFRLYDKKIGYAPTRESSFEIYLREFDELAERIRNDMDIKNGGEKIKNEN